MKVEILGIGCAKCNKLYDLANDVARKNQIDVDIVKVEDIKVFSNYGVFMTPALVVDGEVKIAGKIPRESDILKWMQG